MARILIAEDEEALNAMCARGLTTDGHEVMTVYDGTKAVQIALGERPDVVLLDIGLPGLNGFEVCEAMRSGGLTKPLIVAMTGYGRPEDRQRAIEAGFDDFQVKPVAPPAIRELLAKKVG